MTTDNYLAGWGSQFHYSPFYSGDTWNEARSRHEHSLALMLGMKPSMRVVDAGCGVGGPAREMAMLSQAQITGITISRYQADIAVKLNKIMGLHSETGEENGKVSILVGDFLSLPFSDEQFDIVYATGALWHAPDFAKLFQEMFRVLKPEGRIGFYQEILTDKYSKDNPIHNEIRSRMEQGEGVASHHVADDYTSTLKTAGFIIEYEEDLALTRNPGIPWWYPLDGQIHHASNLNDKWHTFMLRPGPFGIAYRIRKTLSLVGLVRPGRIEAMQTMANCTYGMRDGGKPGIFSPMFMIVARKPGKEDQK